MQQADPIFRPPFSDPITMPSTAAGALCYEGDMINCSGNQDKELNFFAFEWRNPRFGIKTKEVYLEGSNRSVVAAKEDFFTPKELNDNAVALIADDKRYARRVAYMAVGWEFLQLQTQSRVLADKIKAGGEQKADALAQLTKNWQRIKELAEANPYAIHPLFMQAIRKQPVPINPEAYSGPRLSAHEQSTSEMH